MFEYRFDDLFNPVLKALHSLGDSASVYEIEQNVIQQLKLKEDEINEIHRGSITKLSYRLAWARNYLKRIGLVESSERGIWRLTLEGKSIQEVDQNEIYSKVKSLDRNPNQKTIQSNERNEEIDYKTNEVRSILWKEQLIELIKGIDPVKFERLCKLLLRELGFTNVEITKQTNDGGIDGKGLIKVAGVMSFHVVFQCKRYRETVPSHVVRDFRGAFIGRADKGIIITTGNYSNEARKESIRDGAPPIDLIDGNELAELLKITSLGVSTRMVEEVEINANWFKEI